MDHENNPEGYDFAQFLRGRMKERGFNLKKLSEACGIAIKHLESLASGNFHNLPSAPYFRGYVLRLGKTLDFDGGFWWRKLGGAESAESPGTGDDPSKNRFVSTKNKKLAAWITAATVLALLLIALEMPRVIGAPTIKIVSPPGNPAVVNDDQINIIGALENGNELYINGELVNADPDGSWNKVVLLGTGTNSFEIRAKKFLGGETKVIEQIIYEPGATATSTPTAGSNPR